MRSATIICCRLIVLLLVASAARGQAGAQMGSTVAPPAAYGSGEQAQPGPASFTGHNVFEVGADLSSIYTDNAGFSSGRRAADTGLLIAPVAQWGRESARISLALSYRSALLIYRHESAYNEQNHDWRLDARYRATRRLTFRVRTADTYRSGLLESFAQATIVPGLAAPGHLNDTVVAPFATAFETNSRIDATYQASEAVSYDVFATYTRRTLAKAVGQPPGLFDAEGKSAGAQYLGRLNRNVSAGVVYVYNDLRFLANARLTAQEPAVTVAMNLNPRISFYAYAGPEYTHLNDAAFVPLASSITFVVPVARSQWNWAGGGGIAARWESAAFLVNAAHQVTDGGGWLNAVTNSAVDASLERRLAGRWTVRWEAGWQRTVALPGAALEGSLDGDYGRVVLLHRITGSLQAGAGYQYQRQNAGGRVPLGAAFARNYAYLTVSYQGKCIPPGR